MANLFCAPETLALGQPAIQQNQNAAGAWDACESDTSLIGQTVCVQALIVNDAQPVGDSTSPATPRI